MKKPIIILLVVVLVGVIIYALSAGKPSDTTPVPNDTVEPGTEPATSTEPVAEGPTTVLGKSVEGRDIVAYNYGDGENKVLFVGGIHGGYSWNTSLVAYEAMEYFEKNPNAVPDDIQVTIIPVLNPDGLNKVTPAGSMFKASDIKATQAVQVTGRFNANTVDLNRNFDCDWQASGKWQSRTVSGGTAAFSEPETMAIKNYIETHDPVGVVIWYSAAGGVYASSCGGNVSSETTALMNAYAKASGYPAHASFDFYETTGDMANWLAKENIPAVSVLLSNHTSTEWSKNEAGIKAVIDHYSN